MAAALLTQAIALRQRIYDSIKNAEDSGEVVPRRWYQWCVLAQNSVATFERLSNQQNAMWNPP
jgi:hypothetical protein